MSSEFIFRCEGISEKTGRWSERFLNRSRTSAMPSNTAFTSQASASRTSNSVQLLQGVARLEVMLKLTTAILALAAGVYTYLGVRELLNGSPTTVLFAAVIYSVAVSVGIYAFWIFLMQFMPHVVDRTGRGLMFGCMLLGSLMIVA